MKTKSTTQTKAQVQQPVETLPPVIADTTDASQPVTTGETVVSAACCGVQKQQSCCAPSAKANCCGAQAAPVSCGCK